MNGGYSYYDNSEETNIDWIGSIPSHWDVTKIKFVAQLETGHTPSRENPEYWEGGDIPWYSLADVQQVREHGRKYITETNENITQAGIDNSSARLLPKETVVLSRTASIGFPCILGVPAATDQSMVAWICSSRILPEYLHRVFQAMEQELNKLAIGSTHDTIYMSDVEGFVTPLPPIDEQKTIVSFTNYFTERISTLVDKKRELIGLLEERLSKIINMTVSSGLDHHHQTMESVDSTWIEEIPSHWELKRLDHIRDPYTPIVYGIVLPGPNQDEGVPIIKGGDCKPEKLHPEKLAKTTNEIADQYERSQLEAGDLVYEIRGSIGRVVKVPPELEGANLTQDTARIAPRENIDQDWLLYALKSRLFRKQMDLHTRGATVQGVNLFDLRRGVLPIPPNDEQTQIAEYLENVESKLDQLCEMTGQSIQILEEKNQALISKAVTGGIDVRGWVPPDEPKEVPA